MSRRTWYGIAMFSLLFGGLGLAAQIGQGDVSNREVAANVPAEFKQLYEGGIPSEQTPNVWAGFPYDSIELERTACFGTCPIYRVTLFRGGRAELRAVSWQERKGDFAGQVNVFDYGRLCYLLKQLRFDRMAPRYVAGWTDSPTFIVTAVAGGTTIRVSDYSGIGPIELWAIQETIDSVAQRVRWTAK